MRTTAANVIKGAEAFYLKGNEIGILLCHGFNGTPQSVHELGEIFHKFGFTVLALRLNGHGTNIHDMEQTKFPDWITNIEESYMELKKSCRDIFVVGQSMGGALSLQLAAKFPELKGVITINAALHVPCYEQYRNGNGPRFIEEGTPDIKDTQAFEITYNEVPTTAIAELLTLLDHTIKKLDQITCPLLVLTSSQDHVVPPTDSQLIMDRVASANKKQIMLENSYHVASLDFDKQHIADYTGDFINSLVD